MKLNQSNPKPIKSPRALSCVATLSDFFSLDHAFNLFIYNNTTQRRGKIELGGAPCQFPGGSFKIHARQSCQQNCSVINKSIKTGITEQERLLKKHLGNKS